MYNFLFSGYFVLLPAHFKVHPDKQDVFILKTLKKILKFNPPDLLNRTVKQVQIVFK